MADQEKPKKYFDYLITDIHLHVTKPTNPKPLDYHLIKASKNKKPFRVHRKLPPPDKMDLNDADHTFKMMLFDNQEIQRAKAEAERRGLIFRVLMPAEGIPIYAGRDSVEYLEARKNDKWKPHKQLVGK